MIAAAHAPRSLPEDTLDQAAHAPETLAGETIAHWAGVACLYAGAATALACLWSPI